MVSSPVYTFFLKMNAMFWFCSMAILNILSPLADVGTGFKIAFDDSESNQSEALC